MRRWLPLVLLIATAGLIGLVLLFHSKRAEPVAAQSTRALPDDRNSEPTRAEERPEPRVAVTTSSVANPSKTALDPGSAQLLVHVRGKSLKTPIEGAQVLAWPDGPEDHDLGSDTLIPAGQPPSAQTDAAGDATLQLRPGVPFSIDVTSMERTAAGVAIRIAALKPGQRMELEALLPDSNDAHVSGRVVAADTHAGIDGASVVCIDARTGFSSDGSHWGAVEIARVASGPDGSFELDYPAWREPHLRVEAQGFGLKLAAPLKECTDPAHPLVIELTRCASLRAHLTGADGLALDALTVEVEAEGSDLIPEDQRNRGDLSADFPNERWESKTDRSGWVTFPGLPAQTFLAAYIHMGARVVQPEGKGVTLAPDEAKEVEWRMGAGCTLNGFVLDLEGKPVTRTQLWLTPAWRGTAPYFSSVSESFVHQIATTDAQGRFEMSGVPKGEWFLGPAPDGPQYANEASVAPIAERIVIADERSMEVTLRVPRGLYIRGRVLDPDGKPVSGASVQLGDDVHRGIRIQSSSAADGSFSLGPLPAQPLWLVASGFRCVSSLPVRVQPGASAVELRLRRGGTIRGRVVDAASGEGVLASLDFVLEGSDGRANEGWMQGGSEDDGTFESPPLLAGSFSVGAVTDDGRFGFVKGIGISPGAEHADVIVQVKPGGLLRLTYSGSSDSVWGRIVADGVTLGSTGPIRKDKQQTLHLPAGACVLELSDEHDHVLRREIALRAGETRELVVTEKE